MHSERWYRIYQTLKSKEDRKSLHHELLVKTSTLKSKLATEYMKYTNSYIIKSHTPKIIGYTHLSQRTGSSQNMYPCTSFHSGLLNTRIVGTRKHAVQQMEDMIQSSALLFQWTSFFSPNQSHEVPNVNICHVIFYTCIFTADMERSYIPYLQIWFQTKYRAELWKISYT